jgi:hypothetical protein
MSDLDPLCAGEQRTLDLHQASAQDPERTHAASAIPLLLLAKVFRAARRRKIRFELCQREALPFLGLLEQGQTLRWTERRRLPMQRGYRTILAHVSEHRYPTHDHTPCLVPKPIVPVVIFQIVSGPSPEMSNGFRIVEPFDDAPSSAVGIETRPLQRMSALGGSSADIAEPSLLARNGPVGPV